MVVMCLHDVSMWHEVVLDVSFQCTGHFVGMCLLCECKVWLCCFFVLKKIRFCMMGECYRCAVWLCWLSCNFMLWLSWMWYIIYAVVLWVVCECAGCAVVLPSFPSLITVITSSSKEQLYCLSNSRAEESFHNECFHLKYSFL